MGRWIAGNPTAALTVSGGLLYVFFRIALVVFYDDFGVRPEDVGLGYAQTLVQVATSSAVLIAFVGLVILMAVIWELLEDTGAHPDRPIAIAAAVVGFVIMFAGIFLLTARWNAHEVRAGWATKDSPVLNGTNTPLDSFFNPLGISVECVRVVAVSEAGNTVARVLLTDPVLYLGKADGVGVFFRPDTQVTIRTPVDGVALLTTETNDERCVAPNSTE